MKTHVYKDQIQELFRKEHLISIADIQKHIPQADYSTVCRNVEYLLEMGDIKKVVFDKNKVLYEAAETHAHDHFLCTECGSIDEVNVSATIPGYVVTDAVFRGFCTQCK